MARTMIGNTPLPGSLMKHDKAAKAKEKAATYRKRAPMRRNRSVKTARCRRSCSSTSKTRTRRSKLSRRWQTIHARKLNRWQRPSKRCPNPLVKGVLGALSRLLRLKPGTQTAQKAVKNLRITFSPTKTTSRRRWLRRRTSTRT